MILVGLVIAIAGLVGALVAIKLIIKAPQDTWMVFLGSGGHTGEMLRMLNALKVKPPKLVAVLSEGDAMSLQKAKQLKAVTVTVPRARRVGQGWASTMVSSAYSLAASFRVVTRSNPRLLLVNGPGTCVILAAWVLMLRPFGVCTKIVYIESLARVSSLSLSGRILYPVADAFIVQWPELVERYPKSKYIGILV